MKADRVVIDTSILISAALSPSGKPAAAVDHVVVHRAPVFSQPTFEELATRIHRPKFDRYFQAGARQRFLEKLAAVAVWVEIAGGLCVCRDPDDNKRQQRRRATPRARDRC